jgi:hypothetical protein
MACILWYMEMTLQSPVGTMYTTCLTIIKFALCIYMFHKILKINNDYFLKQRHPADLCNDKVLWFLCGTDWILNYYLVELRLQRVNIILRAHKDFPRQVWRWLSSEMLRRVVSWVLTDISEVLIISIITLTLEAGRTSKTSVSIYQTRWLNIPEVSELQIYI